MALENMIIQKQKLCTIEIVNNGKKDKKGLKSKYKLENWRINNWKKKKIIHENEFHWLSVKKNITWNNS